MYLWLAFAFGGVAGIVFKPKTAATVFASVFGLALIGLILVAMSGQENGGWYFGLGLMAMPFVGGTTGFGFLAGTLLRRVLSQDKPK